MKFTAAHGSNLNLEEIKHRCPTAHPVGSGVLQGYRLPFSTYATMALMETGD